MFCVCTHASRRRAQTEYRSGKEFDGILREDAWGLPIIVDGDKEFIEIVRLERSAARDVSPLDVASMP